jgi:hypothetical protein
MKLFDLLIYTILSALALGIVGLIIVVLLS